MSELALCREMWLKASAEFVVANVNASATIEKVWCQIAFRSADDITDAARLADRDCIRNFNREGRRRAAGAPLNDGLLVACLWLDAWKAVETAILTIGLRANDHDASVSISKRG